MDINQGELVISYHVQGRLLEVCNCRVLCPCWIGEDPDPGTCDTIVAWHFDQGTIEHVDVSGRTTAPVAHIAGNILAGNWKVAIYTDGGSAADLVKLIGEVVSVKRAPITFDGGKGTIKIGEHAYAELEPYQGATGTNTTLSDTIFSTVPGAPVYVGKSPLPLEEPEARNRSRHQRLQRPAEHLRVPGLMPWLATPAS